MEKAEEQERLLQESAAELEERSRREDELRKALEAREAERIDIEEKYSSLQVGGWTVTVSWDLGRIGC